MSATVPDCAIAGVAARGDEIPAHHNLSEVGVDTPDVSALSERIASDALNWQLSGTDGWTRSDTCIAAGDHRLRQSPQLVAESFFGALLGDESTPHSCPRAV